MAHTPGPWVAHPDPNAFESDDWCVVIGKSLANIDKVSVCRKRDAHLIAAAPALLDALQAIKDNPNARHEVEMQLGEEIWAVLYKAMGEL